MKEELQDRLVEILTSIQAAAGKASDFALDQLPDVAQSYVLYGKVVATTELALAGLALVVCLYGTYRFIRWMKTEDKWDASPALMVLIPADIGATVWAMSATQAAMLVWLAPKVWLLKEIAHLIK